MVEAYPEKGENEGFKRPTWVKGQDRARLSSTTGMKEAVHRRHARLTLHLAVSSKMTFTTSLD
jgi:hypothetical protein